MRAWQITRLAEPREALDLRDVEIPVRGAGELRVRVLAAAVNFPDVLMCRGVYQVRPDLPFTLGLELCGEVIEACPTDDRFSVGDRVMGMAKAPSGSFADEAIMLSTSAFAVPPELTTEEAAGFTVAYQTAWTALHRRAGIRRGETLLVTAAAGGVGSAAVQLGRAAGARVIAVVGGQAKVTAAEALGAHVVIDRHTDDVVERIKEATGGGGVDVVVDPVGGAAYAWATKCIAFEGRIVVVGFAGGDIQEARLNHALIKNYSILGLHWGMYTTAAPAVVREATRSLEELVRVEGLRPLVGDAMPFLDTPRAVQHLADGGTVGRIVIRGS